MVKTVNFTVELTYTGTQLAKLMEGAKIVSVTEVLVESVFRRFHSFTPTSILNLNYAWTRALLNAVPIRAERHQVQCCLIGKLTSTCFNLKFSNIGPSIRTVSTYSTKII